MLFRSYYVEEQHNVAISQQNMAISLVCEGVFERFPALRAVIIEAGFVWVPAVAWRLDQHWARMKGEVPHLTRKPSDYFRSHLWYSSQPADEPEKPEFLRQSRLLADIWAGLDQDVTLVEDPGRHHFDVIDGLQDPASALVDALLADRKSTRLNSSH